MRSESVFLIYFLNYMCIINFFECYLFFNVLATILYDIDKESNHMTITFQFPISMHRFNTEHPKTLRNYSLLLSIFINMYGGHGFYI